MTSPFNVDPALARQLGDKLSEVEALLKQTGIFAAQAKNEVGEQIEKANLTDLVSIVKMLTDERLDLRNKIIKLLFDLAFRQAAMELIHDRAEREVSREH